MGRRWGGIRIMIKKVGIIVDNYKIIKFKELLKEKGLNDYKIFIYSIVNKTSIIQVTTPEDKIGQLKTICDFVVCRKSF